MKKAAFLLLPLFLPGVATRAQKNKVQIGMGYQRTWMLDKQASPLKYQSREKTFLLGYTHTGTAGKLSAVLNGSWGDFFPTGFSGRQLYNPGYNSDGSPKSDSACFTGTLYNARLNVGYMREMSHGFTKLAKDNLYTRDYAGASVSNELFYTDNMVRNGWLNSSSVNAEFEQVAMLNVKHVLSIKISIPLFARNTRLPYHNSISSPAGEGNVTTFFKQGSRFTWLANFQNIRAEAAYEYGISKKLGLGLHYSGQWLHYSYEKPINLFQNNIGITASLK